MAYDTPAAPDLIAKYEDALTRRTEHKSATLLDRYPRVVGKLIYAVPASRVDCAQAIGMLARCLTFPTDDMMAAAERVAAYLGQHADDGITYGSGAPDLELHAYSDSDWQVEHSTSGFVIMYGGAAVTYSSKRQQSIALSSTEAEIMAASSAAAEIVYIRGLMREMGVVLDAPTVLYVDNQGAVALSKDLKSCQRSRHVERRFLKVCEFVALGEIVVKYVNTKEKPADLLTKPLDAATFRKHADHMMGRKNLLAARCSQAHAGKIRQRTFDVEAAYLKGKFESSEVLYARPPPAPGTMSRTFVRGVPVVWRLKVPLYGEADAGRIWNRTLTKQLVDVQKFVQSAWDPCYFRKVFSNGSRMDLAMYVDDGFAVDTDTPRADEELATLNASFKIDVKPAMFFLGNNVIVH